MKNGIEKALEFATKAHNTQKRKYTDEPYINHPISVMNKLSELEFHETVLIASLLHDLVEDIPIKIEQIEQEFGVLVSRMVNDLTDVYTAKAFPNIRRKERKMLECYRLWKVQGNSKSIKLADLIDNTSSIMEYDKNFAKTYIKEKEEILFVLEGGDQRLMHQAVQLMLKCKKELGLN